jgi:hypothetical protein
MWRSVGAVVLGFVILLILAFAAYTAAYLALGADRAFLPGSYAVSGTWVLIMIGVSLVAAAISGWVCTAVARNGAAPLILAAVVLVVGILLALPSVLGTPPDLGPRTAELGNMQAMQNAQTPHWLALLIPFIEAFGVLVGARFAGPRRAPAYA